jgi:uncharacterized protein (DUF433 family)
MSVCFNVWLIRFARCGLDLFYAKKIIPLHTKKIIMNNWESYITINSDIRFGKPCIRNTRITVSDILGWLAAGMSEHEILEDYPSLQEEHIRAALAFAAQRESFSRILATAV